MSSGRKAIRRNKEMIKRINGILKPQWRSDKGFEMERSNLRNLIGNKRERRRTRKGYVKIETKETCNTRKKIEYWRKKDVKILDYERYWDKIDYKRNRTLYCNIMEIEVIYEDGIFRLLSDVILKENTKTSVIIKSSQVLKHLRHRRKVKGDYNIN